MGQCFFKPVFFQIKKTEIPAPNIAGYRVEKAIALLHEKGLDLSLKIEKLEYSNLVEEGEIISQYPRAGTFVKSGTELRGLLVSKLLRFS